MKTEVKAEVETPVEYQEEIVTLRAEVERLQQELAALGLLPAALSQGVGAETARPFAVVIIGGLFTATLLTMFVLPILYPWFEPKPKKPEELDEEDVHALLDGSI